MLVSSPSRSSNSSSISPTISSRTSSSVSSPALWPNSSTTIAMWLRLVRKSRSSSLSPFDSGTKNAGLRSVRRLSVGERCSFSRSLAIRTPMMLSRRSSKTGKRECPVWMMTCSISSYGASMSSRSMWRLGTMTSPAVMSAIRRTPSSIIRDSGSISSFCSASASRSMSWSRESGPRATKSSSFFSRGRFSAGAADLSAPRVARAAGRSDIGDGRGLGGRTAGSKAYPMALRAPAPAGSLERAPVVPMWHARVRRRRPAAVCPTLGEPMALIPATILTGFLGSGKTTLLKRVLTEAHGQKIAVIENEFGEENIDNEILVQDAKEQIIQLNNGCVCCTIREDLRTTLSTLAEKKRKGELDFERVVIETTGLADPGPVAQTFFIDDEIAESYLLDSILTLVDAKHADSQLDTRQEARRQIGFADRIFISKTDLVDESEVEELIHRLKHMNPRAPQERVHFGEVPIAKVFDLRGFNLNAKLDIDPDFLEAGDDHEHA